MLSSFAKDDLGSMPYDLPALFADIPLRLAHMQDASAFAKDLGHCFHLPAHEHSLLLRAALLHDIGYAPALHKFSFHPLDGAIFLEQHQEHPWVVEGVLRHSQAENKALTKLDLAHEYAVRPALPQAQSLVRMTTIADWRAAGVGGRVSFGQRLHDIISRNPGNVAKEKRARAMVDEVRTWFWAFLADTSHAHPLPWIFCDIDNTLIRPGDTLSARNRKAIKSYVAAGGRLTLATGKHPLSIRPLIMDLGLEVPQIAANGTCWLHKGAVQIFAHLDGKEDALQSRLEALGLPVAVYRVEGIEAGRIWPQELGELFERYGEIRPVHQSLPGPALKILCVADDQDLEQEQTLRALAKSLDVDICRSDRYFLEFLPWSGNKGETARLVMDQADWPVLHSFALGDAENDATMFSLCGACAAVANGSMIAKRGADWVVDPCTQDGVAKMLELLLAQQGWAALQADLPYGPEAVHNFEPQVHKMD
ncbi:MAG: HAD hydrolase family protein [Desulfomicrobium sp.]|nr:HAD hydrolase family protein [Desulfomicrobium sp.]